MAKTAEKNHLWKGPWKIKKAEVDKNYVKVTVLNYQNAKKIGRIFYIFESSGKEAEYNGSFVIQPILQKGWYMWPFMPFVKKGMHFRVFVDEDEDAESYKKNYKFILEKHLSEGSLYINPSDPILTFIKQ